MKKSITTFRTEPSSRYFLYLTPVFYCVLDFHHIFLQNIFHFQKIDLKEFTIGDIPIEILDVESTIENNDVKLDFVASYHGNALIKT